MLKAFRFDEEKHKHLIDFINNFKDKNNKPNDSEAIRYLMTMGYNTINNYDNIKKQIRMEILSEQQTNKQNIDINTIKKELLMELQPNVIQEQKVNNEDYIKNIVAEITSKNYEEIKNQVINEVLTKVNNSTISNLDNLIEKLSNLSIQPQAMQSQIVQQQTINQQDNLTNFADQQQKFIDNNIKPKPQKPKVEIPIDTNPLLANLLSNANR